MSVDKTNQRHGMAMPMAANASRFSFLGANSHFMRYCLPLCFVLALSPLFGQKMLLLERANRAKTTKLYVGQTLTYALVGDEKYWYERTITDLLPESSLLLLDNFPVKLTNIAAIRVRRRPIVRLIGATIFTFGASLAVATTVAALYRDRETRYGLLYGTAVGSIAGGYVLNTRRVLKMGEKHRLRIIEIKFVAPGK